MTLPAISWKNRRNEKLATVIIIANDIYFIIEIE